MKLAELIIAVREEKLDKNQLEDYRNQLSNLFAQMMMECAELEKEEALFMHDHEIKMIDATPTKLSVAERKVMWKATTAGQRLIQLKRYALAIKEMLNSLKSRLYNFY